MSAEKFQNPVVRWIDHRLPVFSMLDHEKYDYPVPKNLNYMWNFGVLAGMALANIEVDVSKIAVGQSITVKWRGKPVFIRHRTADEIARASATDITSLRDPQDDVARAEKPEYLVLVGVCTHLGCVPLGQKTGEVRGDYDGWFCPCHGSHYDTSGRIRKGPAPTNLEVPPHNYLSDSVIRIG